jgi:hypothetical protein
LAGFLGKEKIKLDPLDTSEFVRTANIATFNSL